MIYHLEIVPLKPFPCPLRDGEECPYGMADLYPECICPRDERPNLMGNFRTREQCLEMRYAFGILLASMRDYEHEPYTCQMTQIETY